jgi:uncharacterized protein YgbK (DUF1537 family)
MTIRLGCIADDFTGATNLANNLVRAGMRTVQMIGVPDPAKAAPADADAVVVALKSRTAPVDHAVAESRAAARWLRAHGAAQIYFKRWLRFESARTQVVAGKSASGGTRNGMKLARRSPEHAMPCHARAIQR